MALRIKKFDGINVSSSALLSPPESAVNAYNVRIDNQYGALNNDVGYYKYNTSHAPAAITALLQLKKHGYVNVNQTLFNLTGNKWWLDDFLWYYWNYWDDTDSNTWSGSNDYITSFYNNVFYGWRTSGFISSDFDNTTYSVWKSTSTLTWDESTYGKINDQSAYKCATWIKYPYGGFKYAQVHNLSNNLIAENSLENNSSGYNQNDFEYDSIYSKFIIFRRYGTPDGYSSISTAYGVNAYDVLGNIGGYVTSSYYDQANHHLYTTINNGASYQGIAKFLFNSNSSITLISTLGGARDLYFNNPRSIYANNGNIYVADAGTNKIIKTDFSNSFRKTYSVSISPYFVRYDSEKDFIYYSDQSQHIGMFRGVLFS